MATTSTRSIVITGASSGIGRATALRLFRRGWRVFAAVRKAEDAREIAAEAGVGLETVQLDLADRESVFAAARDVERRLDGCGLHGLFNNAGIGIFAAIEHLDPGDLRKAYEINVFGHINMIQAFLPLVRRAKGRIINAGSVGDHLTPPFAGAIASPKAAFASLSMALRLELRPQGVHVVIVEPGSINTPAVEKTLGGVEKIIANLSADAVGRYGEAMRRSAKTFARNERAGSHPEIVAAVVERALTDRNPKTRYLAGKDSWKLTMLAKLLPEKLLDKTILRAFGLPTAFDKPIK